MRINKDKILGIDPNVAQYRSLPINKDQFFSIKINADQLIFIEKNWSLLIDNDRQWSLLSHILDQFLKSDLYWSALIGIGDWSSMSCSEHVYEPYIFSAHSVCLMVVDVMYCTKIAKEVPVFD